MTICRFQSLLFKSVSFESLLLHLAMLTAASLLPVSPFGRALAVLLHSVIPGLP